MEIKDFYISPTSLMDFYRNRDDWVLNRVLREGKGPQTLPMAIGAGFDALVKGSLIKDLGTDSPDISDELFRKQVQFPELEGIRRECQWILDRYREYGAYSDLLVNLGRGVGKARFEFEVRGTLESSVGDIRLLGRPDCFYRTELGLLVILDWKVNGFLSKYKVSPKNGYLISRPEGRESSECLRGSWKGEIINIKWFLEGLAEDWATQLVIYSWILGNRVGEEVLGEIHQVTGNRKEGLKVSEFRNRIGADFQNKIWSKVEDMWSMVTQDWYFKDKGLSIEDSRRRVEVLRDKDFREMFKH